MMHFQVGSLIREMRTRGPELWVWMGDRPFSALAMYLSLWWAVGWPNQGGLWLWDDQSLWSCIMWVVLDFSQITDVIGMPLWSYRVFKGKTGERRKEWGKDRKCGKRWYPGLSTEIPPGPVFSNIAHAEFMFILVNLGTLFKLGELASRLQQITKIPQKKKHFFCFCLLISIQLDIYFIWCCLL